MSSQKKLILALDFASAKEALPWVDRCLPYVKLFKVGKQLFTSEGPSIVREIQSRGGDVFLDLKYHDIPNTVAAAVKAASKLGVFMLNVHVAGGIEMMRAAKQAAREANDKADKKLLLIGVTVLTSMSTPSDKSVVDYAKLAKEAGLDGVVSSVHEVEAIKKACGADFITVTPGIRTADDQKDDQSRIATPQRAIQAGSDYLVMGRSIFNAANPIEKLKQVLQEMSDE